MTDYPQGDGRPDCKFCQGRGVVRAPVTPNILWERTQPCACVFVRDVAQNIERGWKGLLTADAVPSSPLRGQDKKNLRITATRRDFRAHLKHVAARMPPSWGFLVVTDADLMDSWLSRKLDVRDADINQMRQQAEVHRFDALVDMIEPPTLLVLLCGVKAARNEAMPEVLLEALRHREHLSKITWVVDQPTYTLAEGHISYSHAVGEFLSEWPRVNLSSNTAQQPNPPPRPAPPPRPLKQPDLPTGEVFTFEPDNAPPPKPDGLSAYQTGTRSMLEDTDGDAPPDKRYGRKGRRK